MPFNVAEIENQLGKYRPMYKDKLAEGKMKFMQFEKSYEFQFIDYIHGGCDVSVLVAMDFSLSNKHYSNPQSLHYMPKTNP